jgi:tRNA (guanine26-N2/guanine27-N2)-dimethyltransferase
MDFESKLKLISEGATKFWTFEDDISEKNKRAGPGNASMAVFFNPGMEFNRDLSIMVIEEFLAEKVKEAKKQVNLIDGLAGTGVRGIRFESELTLPDEFETTILINDHNPLAFNLIKKNIEFNNLKSAQATRNDLNAILIKNRFDYIDIDPFGSPIKYLDSATRVLKNNGILAVTATDTAALFGTHPKTCIRRYDAQPCRTKFSHELGIRILIGAVVRIGAHHNIGLRPILVHATDHYYRLYLRNEQGRKNADTALNEIGYILKGKKSNRYKVITRKELYSREQPNTKQNNNVETLEKKDSWKLAGPLWTGPLFDPNFIKRLKIGNHKFGTKDQITKLLSIWFQESLAPVGFYDVNSLSSELSVSTPPLEHILQHIVADGFIATRTHFYGNAFKSDAPFEKICAIFNKYGGRT